MNQQNQQQNPQSQRNQQQNQGNQQGQPSAQQNQQQQPSGQARQHGARSEAGSNQQQSAAHSQRKQQ